MPIIINIIISIFLIAASLVFIFRNKLIAVLDYLLKISLVLLILTSLTALYIPQFFHYCAGAILENNGTLQTVQEIDRQTDLTIITNDSSNQINNFFNWLTGNNSQTANQPNNTEAKTIGNLEKNLYPELVTSLANVLQIIVLICSLAGICGIIYLSLSTNSSSKLEELAARIKTLEKNNN